MESADSGGGAVLPVIGYHGSEPTTRSGPMASSDETEVDVSSRSLIVPIDDTGRVGALTGGRAGRKATGPIRVLGRSGSLPGPT